jgi:ribonuclease J
LSTHVHVSGHASAEELKIFYNVVRPQAVVPVHGEYRHLAANARIAKGMGVEEVEVLEDGDAVVLENGKLRIERGAVAAGYVYVDGTEVGDAAGVIRDRRHLADDGVVIVTVGVDVHNGEIVIGPDVDSHGVIGETADLHDLIRERVTASIGTLDVPIDVDVLRTRVRNVARKAAQKDRRRRPVVFPVVIEL